MTWPPAASDFYLAGSTAGRSVFQGDVFEDVPFMRVGAADHIDADPKVKFDRRDVAPILYPCDMVGPDGITLLKQQPVALVYDALETGLQVPEDWEGALGVCPLPELKGDGRLWVADFRVLGVVPRQNLVPGRRIRCLSELGWAVFRLRLVGAATRVVGEIEDFVAAGAAMWKESVYEARWVECGRRVEDFQAWLDDEDVYVPGVHVCLREALHAEEWHVVEDALDDELSPA